MNINILSNSDIRELARVLHITIMCNSYARELPRVMSITIMCNSDIRELPRVLHITIINEAATVSNIYVIITGITIKNFPPVGGKLLETMQSFYEIVGRVPWWE